VNFYRVAIYAIPSGQETTFHTHTELEKLLFHIPSSLVFWKVNVMVTVFELNNNKHFRNLLFQLLSYLQVLQYLAGSSFHKPDTEGN